MRKMLKKLFGLSLVLPFVLFISSCGGGGPVAQTISIDDVSVNESNSTETADLVFTVTITKDPEAGSDVTVDWATSDSTATTADSDYVAGNNTLTFTNGGALTQEVTVIVTGDNTVEPDEILYVNLSNVSNATISDDQGVGTITNDDFPGLSIDDVSVAESDSTETANLVFTVSVSEEPAVGYDVGVDWATSDGSATIADSDYVAGNNTLTFTNGGALTQQVTVVVTGDDTAEPDEILYVDLSSAVNATISDDQGEGTITDDDTVPLLIDAGIVKGTMMPLGFMTAVTVSHDGSPVDDATVTVNGTTIPSTGSGGEYQLFGVLVITGGDDVTLDVTYGSRNVNVTLAMPEAPVITAPTAAGSPYDPAADLTVLWNAFSTDPTLMQILVPTSYTVGPDYMVILSGTDVSHDIPADTLASGVSNAFVVVIGGNMIFDISAVDADAAAGSQLGVGNQTLSELFDTQ